MAVDDRSKAKPKASTNGCTNGSLNGNGNAKMNGLNGINGHANGRAVAPKRRTSSKKSSGFFPWSLGVVARLLTWYSIVTVLFRCPSTLDACTESSPKICKPYFQAKQAISPHLTPYYDTYAAPYADRAKPYYNTVDRIVVTPARTYAVKYGGPQLVKAQAFGNAQWEKNVQPQLVKYQALAKNQYDQAISPHVEKATSAVAPYYDIARTNALQTYHELLLPGYLFVQPYAAQTYNVAHTFTTDTAIPASAWAWNKTYVFLDATIWPHLRDVYDMKVEPQLVRIGERLGRYNGKKPKTASQDVDSPIQTSSFAKPSSSLSSTTSSAVESVTESGVTSSNVESARIEEPTSGDVKIEVKQAPSTPEELRALAAKTVAEDLELWEGKFTQAADEGAAEIEERIDEISVRMIERNAKTMGKALVQQLGDTVNSELEGLKKAILAVLEKNIEKAEERDAEINAAVRSSGLNIKNKAQDIRSWHKTYDQETEIAVTKAAQEHFSILERTRDLALQRIGMKWAWMDGVTYEHWKKYHQLKAKFGEWTEDLKLLITSHPGLLNAQAAGTEVEDEAMGIAQAAAEELARLRQVAAWKATAGDASDDFDSNTMRLAAEAVRRKVEEAAEQVTSAAHSVADDVASGSESVSELMSDNISSVFSGEATGTSASEGLGESDTVTVSLSQAQEEDNATTETLKDSTDESTSAADPSEPLPTSDTVDGPEQIQETITETPDEPTPVPVEDPATATIKSVWLGAAAQQVPSRQPILDDNFSSSASSVASVVQSDVPAGITSAAQVAYTAAVAGAADRYSRAMSAVSVQISGEPKPLHEEMRSSVSNAYFAALASANVGLSSALTAASEGVYGTPTTNWLPNVPTVPSVDWERVQSIAQQNLDDSVQWASDQYEAAKVAVGVAEPTPSTYLEGAGKQAEKALDQAKHNYYAGLGLAHARYSEFLSAASSAVSSLTATPTPTNIQESASSAASVASESVADAASAASDTIVDAASAASGSIGENWNFLVSQVSSQIYGAPTPTPWYENVYAAAGDYASAAGDYAASATDAAADQISAATSIAGDYASAAGGYASSATDAAASRISSATSVVNGYAGSAGDAASSQYSAVSSLVSELVSGKEPDFTQSVYSRLAGAYGTGVSSASSFASAASASAASAASEVTEAASSVVEAAADTVSTVTEKVKETVEHVRDEL